MKFDAEHSENNDSLTIAFFIGIVFEWFALVTSRTSQLALSKLNPNEYQKAIQFLKEIFVSL